MTLDENLTWKNHVGAITKKISSGISALKRVRGLIDNESAIKAYQGFIEHYFSFCAPVWDGLRDILSDWLQKLQNRQLTLSRVLHMTFHLISFLSS